MIKSMQHFSNQMMTESFDVDKETTKESANPLKMVKEYKTQHLKASIGKQTHSAYGSNASTKAFYVNDEQERVNRIMHEPIENLISNMNNLSRPVSSKHTINMLTAQRRINPYRNKKERAMTAGNDKSLLASRGRANGLKIAESAYHIGRQPPTGLNQAYSGYSASGKNHATSLSGQVIGSRFPTHYNQSTQNLFGARGAQNALKQNQSMVL